MQARRRLLKAESVKAVVLINNLFYDTGTNAQGIHNAVGLHYDLPIVSVRNYIFPEIQLKRLSCRCNGYAPPYRPRSQDDS